MPKYNFNWSHVKRGAPFITISKHGIAFNKICTDFLGKPQEIMIGFDIDNLALGVRSVDAGDFPDSFRYIEKQRDGWVRIGCKDFISYVSQISTIDFTTETRKFIPILDKDEQMLIVELKQAIPDNEE